MDLKIIAVSTLSVSQPIPVEDVIARFYGENKKSLLEGSLNGKDISFTLRCKTLSKGCSEETLCHFKIAYYGSMGNISEVITLQDPKDEKSRFFVDLGSGKD